MKKLFFKTKKLTCQILTMGFIAFTCSSSLISCIANDDDDDDDDFPQELMSGDLDDAPYKNDAVKYTVTGDSKIGFIELTASGNYIIMPPSDETNQHLITQNKTIFQAQNIIASRTIDLANAHYGTFTKSDDNTYELSDFGTIQEKDNNQLIIKEKGQTERTVSFEKAQTNKENTLNNRLNHTWELISATIKITSSNGKILFSKNITDQTTLEEEFVKAILVTNHGSFYQIEWNNEISDYGLWQWSDETNQIFTYTWLTDTPEGGSVQVKFKDDTADFYETHYEYSEEYGQEITIMTIAHTKAIN